MVRVLLAFHFGRNGIRVSAVTLASLFFCVSVGGACCWWTLLFGFVSGDRVLRVAEMTEAHTMSNLCARCQVKEGLPAGKWYVCQECVGRLTTPAVLREVCVDKSLASSLGSWDPKSPSPFRCRECISIETARLRKALVEVYTNRCDPMAARKDISTGGPGRISQRFPAREASPPAANASGIADTPGRRAARSHPRGALFR